MNGSLVQGTPAPLRFLPSAPARVKLLPIARFGGPVGVARVGAFPGEASDELAAEVRNPALTILEYIAPSRIGGAETYFLRLVAHLGRAGHRVIVVTKRDCALRRELEARVAQMVNVEIHAWHTHGKTDAQSLARLCRLIRAEHVDLVHTHLTTASLLGSMAGRICGVPVACHVHCAEKKTYFQFGDYLIAVAEGVRQHLLRQGVNPAKVPVLHYGLDLDFFRNPMPRAQARRQLGLPDAVKIVGVVASLQERKGHRYLLRALADLGPDLGPVHAVFAGEGPLEKALRAQARRLKLSENVHFLGFRDDISTVLSACDIVALPSRKEGLSIATMEAMALGRPVVVTPVAGMPELVKERVTGLLVPAGETAPLSRALETIWRDPALQNALSRNGRAWLEQKFDQRDCMRRIESFLVEAARSWQNGERVDCATWGPECPTGTPAYQFAPLSV